VTSNNPDYIELINIGSTDVDISGWVITDDTPEMASHRYTIPNGTHIPAGMLLGLPTTQFMVGLGNPSDKVQIFTPATGDAGTGELVDMFGWTVAPSTGGGYSRCPDGTGTFVDRPLTSGTNSAGALNNCP